MSIVVTGTQFITNTAPPLTDVPITLGVWVRSTSVNGLYKAIWQLTNSDDLNRFALYQSGGNKWMALTTAAGTDDLTAEAGTVTANVWQFMVARWISSTNRWISVLSNDGSTAHLQSTVSSTPAGQDRLTVGAQVTGGEPFVGQIAELWYTNTDIQPDGAQLQDSMLRQLAYGGPFSVPHIAKDILEYRSFRKHPFLDERGEVYYGGMGIQTWVPTSTPTTGSHPPLPSQYIKPNAPVPTFRRLLASGLFNPVSSGPLIVGWMPEPAQTWPKTPAPFDTTPAIALTPATLPPKNSGMPWFEPPDIFQPRPIIRQPGPAIALTPSTLPPKVSGMAWLEPPDQQPKPPPRFEPPPALTLPPPSLLSRLAGMPWFEPPDQQPRPPPRFEPPPALALTPATLPPKVSGIAWSEPPDVPSKRRSIFDTAPTFVANITTPVVTVPQGWAPVPDVLPRRPVNALDVLAFVPNPGIAIGGSMGWFVPPDATWPRKILAGDVLAFVPIPDIASGRSFGWFMVPDAPGLRKLLAASDPPALGSVTIVPVPVGWLIAPEAISSRSIISPPGPVFVFSTPTPPTPVSGMAWFAPPDVAFFSRAMTSVTAPAWSPQEIIIVTPPADAVLHALPFIATVGALTAR